MSKICLLNAKRPALRDYLGSTSGGKIDFLTLGYRQIILGAVSRLYLCADNALASGLAGLN